MNVCLMRSMVPKLMVNNMKFQTQSVALLATLLLVPTSFAQVQAFDKAAAKAERLVQGSEAARTFVPGEGDPKPAGRPKVDRAARVAEREGRKPERIEAARSFKPGEGDPKPIASIKLSRDQRAASREAKRDEVIKLNKAGNLPSYGENYGGK